MKSYAQVYAIKTFRKWLKNIRVIEYTLNNNI